MQEADTREEVVRRAAARGAKSFTRRRQLIEDAVASVMERWEDAVMRQKVVANWEAWAFRVGANAAQKLGATQARAAASVNASAPHVAAPVERAQREDEASAIGGARVGAKRRLQAHLAKKLESLRGRQLEVVMKMAEPQMSFHRAAKELGMARANVRRAFQSALRRLHERKK